MDDFDPATRPLPPATMISQSNKLIVRRTRPGALETSAFRHPCIRHLSTVVALPSRSIIPPLSWNQIVVVKELVKQNVLSPDSTLFPHQRAFSFPDYEAPAALRSTASSTGLQLLYAPYSDEQPNIHKCVASPMGVIHPGSNAADPTLASPTTDIRNATRAKDTRNIALATDSHHESHTENQKPAKTSRPNSIVRSSARIPHPPPTRTAHRYIQTSPLRLFWT
ncbi:hypothetical protein HYPSUDRAFT_209783 [Hypholoma sublateritium FD-334 SS-4]|nr:hypothetical protein HYPSUDRAFT_209783 [Hypholoma sublateritium FD-334 SS-4]